MCGTKIIMSSFIAIFLLFVSYCYSNILNGIDGIKDFNSDTYANLENNRYLREFGPCAGC